MVGPPELEAGEGTRLGKGPGPAEPEAAGRTSAVDGPPLVGDGADHPVGGAPPAGLVGAGRPAAAVPGGLASGAPNGPGVPGLPAPVPNGWPVT